MSVSRRSASNMKAGIVFFLCGLAFIHMTVADSIKAVSEKPDDDSLEKWLEELPDGVIFEYDNSVFDVNITRDNEMLLGHIAIFLKNCTDNKCYSHQYFKFGNRIIYMSFLICDKDGFFNENSEQLLNEEDSNLKPGDDNEDHNDAQENIKDI
ncbi:uncharacterized protein LOC143930807 [Lithobates pipiens]